MEEALFFTNFILQSMIFLKNIMQLCFLCSKWFYCINMLKKNSYYKYTCLFAQFYCYEKASFSSNLNDGQKKIFKKYISIYISKILKKIKFYFSQKATRINTEFLK